MAARKSHLSNRWRPAADDVGLERQQVSAEGLLIDWKSVCLLARFQEKEVGKVVFGIASFGFYPFKR